MNIEGLLDHFGPNFAEPHRLTPRERDKLRREIEPVWNGYINMPLTLLLDDSNMTRLCQLLTNLGYQTFSSCEGHGREEPHVYFLCRSANKVAELADVIRKTAITNFSWVVEIDGILSGNRFKAYYALTPRPKRGNFDIVKSRKQLVDDFDILGYSIFDHFQHDR